MLVLKIDSTEGHSVSRIETYAESRKSDSSPKLATAGTGEAHLQKLTQTFYRRPQAFISCVRFEVDAHGERPALRHSVEE